MKPYSSPQRLISIIIPFRDEFDYLAEALECSVGQREIISQILVVRNHVDPVSEDHPIRIQFHDATWLHEPRIGSAHARNKGLAEAGGDWVQFLDVDDLLQPQKISNQLGHDDADAVVSPHLFQKTNGKQIPSKWLPDDFWSGLLNSGLGSTSSMLFKRTALQAIGGWNPDFQSHQEYELIFRLAKNGKHIASRNEPLTIVRERHSGSITHQSSSFRAAEGIHLRELMWAYLTDHRMVTEGRKDAFERYIFRQLRGLYRQDPETAILKYREIFAASSFIPEETGVPGYTWLYRGLGFRRTEQILSAYSRLRNKYFPFLPSNG